MSGLDTAAAGWCSSAPPHQLSSSSSASQQVKKTASPKCILTGNARQQSAADPRRPHKQTQAHSRRLPHPHPPSVSYPSICCVRDEVCPVSISCLCWNTAMRALPRPSSSSGRPSAPCVSTATRVDLPESTPPATAGGGRWVRCVKWVVVMMVMVGIGGGVGRGWGGLKVGGGGGDVVGKELPAEVRLIRSAQRRHQKNLLRCMAPRARPAGCAPAAAYPVAHATPSCHPPKHAPPSPTPQPSHPLTQPLPATRRST